MLPTIEKWFYDGRPLRCAWCGSTNVKKIDAKNLEEVWGDTYIFQCECKMFTSKASKYLNLQLAFDF